LAALPFYASFIFGLARDTWRPFGISDRTISGVFGLISAIIYGAFAFIPVTVDSLLAAMLLSTCAYQMSPARKVASRHR
jgi:hypothetical protein